MDRSEVMFDKITSHCAFFIFIYTANGEPSSYPTISADFFSFTAILIALIINSLHYVLNQTAFFLLFIITINLVSSFPVIKFCLDYNQLSI